MVALVLIESARQWIGVLSGREEARVKESPFVMTRLAEEQAMSRFVKAARIVLTTLREIFDESAYERFLRRRQMSSSPAMPTPHSAEEFEEAKTRRPKCC